MCFMKHQWGSRNTVCHYERSTGLKTGSPVGSIVTERQRQLRSSYYLNTLAILYEKQIDVALVSVFWDTAY